VRGEGWDQLESVEHEGVRLGVMDSGTDDEVDAARDRRLRRPWSSSFSSISAMKVNIFRPDTTLECALGRFWTRLGVGAGVDARGASESGLEYSSWQELGPPIRGQLEVRGKTKPMVTCSKIRTSRVFGMPAACSRRCSWDSQGPSQLADEWRR
jgi:hypothetical protein